MSFIIGAVLAVIGLIMTVWGGTQRSSWEYQAIKEWAGSTSETRQIDAVVAFGVIFLLAGIGLIVYTVLKNSNAGNGAGRPINLSGVKPGVAAQNQCRCAKCGAMMNGAMQFCPECGSQDKFFTQTPSAPNVQPPASFCGGCGAPLAPGETFCHACGKKK